MKTAKLVGIGGTDGSGKDTVAQMLVERHGWLFISVTDILREEVRRRGLPLKREHLRAIGNEWRRQLGMGVLIEKAVKEYDSEKYKGLVISSLRNPGEADKLHELGGKVVWTDADPHTRYARVVGRKRGNEDEVSFEEFLAEENTQMSHSGDEATLNLRGVKERADIFIENHGNDIEAFKNQAEEALANLL